MFQVFFLPHLLWRIYHSEKFGGVKAIFPLEGLGKSRSGSPISTKKSSLELDGGQPAMPGAARPEGSLRFVRKQLKPCLVLVPWAIWVPKAPSHTNPTSRKLPAWKGGENNKWVLLGLLHFHSSGTKAVNRGLCEIFWLLPGC